MKNKKQNKTEIAKSEKQINHEIYVYAHKNFSYKDAVEFIRIATRKCE